ncbi:ArnT family glycosyltransferase [Chondromyces apiculatus]|uniref:Glycosyltransferase RgtA/B/C/D-like domain-containing protein n=1 Tax=Chondromyces apiculatus DSM 436 TaxID=1192034 RepID=A0A017TJ85_9BACT|nr:glycosyltransferase family 39 protein [Chondromyces apiculatus]EYF08947.1 Hypothetical protein CAP_0031 [Chondromyces apiculatus DSM 436]
MNPASATRWRRDAAAIFALALVARLMVVAWAAGRFAPAADGAYYHRLATRLATGLGYTWSWPDGVVTYAAHYPVGYPGALAAVYALFGPHPAGAMVLNAFMGALAALAVHRLAVRATSRRLAALAGGLVALHPGLVAYTPALMTEAVTGALLACGGWATARAAERKTTSRSLTSLVVLGLILGAATLVRPQSLLLAPVFGWIAARGRRSRLAAVAVTSVALAVCAPWTARNCVRMGSCALVSVNGGWNLLIGANHEGNGAWAPLEVPDGCRHVFDEAGKDACFGRAARQQIASRPAAWLALIPRKLAATFDYCGAAGWYLHDANPAAFDHRQKVALGAVETIYERLVLILCLVGAWRAAPALTGRRVLSAARLVLFIVGLLAAFHVHAWIGYVVLLGLFLLHGRALLGAPVLTLCALSVLGTTLLTHAAFFGAGRYALVTFPLLSGLAALGVHRFWPDSPSKPGAEVAGTATPGPSKEEQL